MAKFSTKYERVHSAPIQLNPKSKMDVSQGMPIAMRVQNLVMAGKLNQAYKADQYDFQGNDGIDNVVIDITRKRGVDLVDVMQAQKELQQSIQEKRLEKFKKLQKQQQDAYEAQLIQKLQSEGKIVPEGPKTPQNG